MTNQPQVSLARDDGGNGLLVAGPSCLTESRRARLFFVSLLGGSRVRNGWHIPARRRSMDSVSIQVVAWLRSNGYAVQADSGLDAAVQREEERRRSFDRTLRAAESLREGNTQTEMSSLKEALARAGWNFGERSLRDHQYGALIHGLTCGNFANFSVPGTGKTASTLALAGVHLGAGLVDAVLVVGPLACFRPWEEETRAALPSINVVRVRGDSLTRREILRSAKPGCLLLASYATAAADKVPLIEFCRRLNVMLVADESHRIKRFSGGLWASAVVDIAKYARVRGVLSGTPMPQSGRDLYSQLNVLWPGQELTGPKQRFAAAVDRDFDSTLKRIQPFLFRTSKEELGLAPAVIERHAVELSSAESEIYAMIVENLRSRVRAAGPSEAAQLEALRRGRHMRLLQAVTNSALLSRQLDLPSAGEAGDGPTLLARLRDFGRAHVTPAKNAFALRLLENKGHFEKAVVWSSFIGNLDDFSELVRSRSDYEVFQVDGRVLAAQSDADDSQESISRERVIAGFLAHRGPALLVANPASCSESISLHRACRLAIYLDRSYDCAQWLQSIDRIHRLGLAPDARVEVHLLQALAGGQPTIDSLVDASLLRKETLMRKLLEGAQLHPLEEPDDLFVAGRGDVEDLRALLRYLLGVEA